MLYIHIYGSTIEVASEHAHPPLSGLKPELGAAGLRLAGRLLESVRSGCSGGRLLATPDVTNQLEDALWLSGPGRRSQYAAGIRCAGCTHSLCFTFSLAWMFGICLAWSLPTTCSTRANSPKHSGGCQNQQQVRSQVHCDVPDEGPRGSSVHEMQLAIIDVVR